MASADARHLREHWARVLQVVEGVAADRDRERRGGKRQWEGVSDAPREVVELFFHLELACEVDHRPASGRSR
jgi:hypothetical protein